jgi:tetratricopeptide (TPR) repeat protein
MMSSTAQQFDARGVPVSSCDNASLEDYETALRQFQSYFGDPTETLATTLENDPEFVMGHIFNASAMLTTSERQYLPMVTESLDAADALASKSNDREKALISAARLWVDGKWTQACGVWDQVLAEHPRDAMTIQCAHLTDFLMGDATNLRDRIARVLGHWDKDVPGYSFILGMQAFGFEECNHYDAAEEAAMKALSIEPRDGWSIHAMAHVMEMQNRHEEGRQFLTSRSDDWSPGNGFAFHNWWHCALYHLEQEDFDGAVDLYDDHIFLEDSDSSMQLLDASALLWRLQLQGVDSGSRWKANADLWEKKIPAENGYYPFNDMHAVLSFIGSDQKNIAVEILKDMESAANKNPALTAMMLNDVGIPACAAMIAFAEERYSDVVDKLFHIRSYANRFGGSHAQRDILTQTLIEAAVRSGQMGLASNLLCERSILKPHSPLTKRFKQKITH